MKRLISGEIVLMRVSKLQANTLNVCYGVWIRDCRLVVTFKDYITMLMNRLTNAALHKVGRT